MRTNLVSKRAVVNLSNTSCLTFENSRNINDSTYYEFKSRSMRVLATVLSYFYTLYARGSQPVVRVPLVVHEVWGNNVAKFQCRTTIFPNWCRI